MRFLSLMLLVVLTAAVSAGCRKLAPTPPAPVATVKRPAGDAATDGLIGAATTPAIGAPAAVPAKRAIRHVIIISEDGLRPDALMDVRPPVHESIMHKGSY